MKVKEIGSEFYLDKSCIQGNDKIISNNLYFGEDNKLVFLGRTAIDYVLNDILNDRKIKKAYLPSYCCSSIIQPFIDREINIDFYDVYYDNGLKYNIDYKKECDIFFVINYFGYQDNSLDYYIDILKQRNIVIIEDITHSLLSRRVFNKHSNYVIASLRKWFGILSGGIACKIGNIFYEQKLVKPEEKIINNKFEAMTEKRNYLNNGNEIRKKVYLEKFEYFNEKIINYYKNIDIDDCSINILKTINIELIREQRINNSRIIYSQLKNCNEINFLNEIKDGDCPLFVPLIMKKNIKEKISQGLINKKIYCPSHWPKPNIECKSNIYGNELSLICDQRYKLDDMYYMTETIKKIIKEV